MRSIVLNELAFPPDNRGLIVAMFPHWRRSQQMRCIEAKCFDAILPIIEEAIPFECVSPNLRPKLQTVHAGSPARTTTAPYCVLHLAIAMGGK